MIGRAAFPNDGLIDGQEAVRPEAEQRLRREFWEKVKRVAQSLPFAEDLLAANYCAFDSATPRQVKAALVGAIVYFILPFDVVPDILPVLGYSDDAAVLFAALRLVAGHIRPEHREAARLWLEGSHHDLR